MKPVSQWKRHPRDWAESNRAAHLLRAERERTEKAGICVECGSAMSRGNGAAKWCSTKCKYEHSKRDPDPFMAKANTMASSIRLGKGKRKIIADMLRAAVDRPCRYCGQIITLANANIDHMEPVTGLRGTPLAAALDRPDNLQVVCARCNGLKGNLSHVKYQKLLDFLRTDQEIYNRVLVRLGQSKRFWAIKKGRKSP